MQCQSPTRMKLQGLELGNDVFASHLAQLFFELL
jgi:hypothetical protein